jgi:hypothetical protein
VNERLMLNSSAAIRYQSEPDISLNAAPVGSARSSGITAPRWRLIYWLPRFSTVTSYSLNAVDYVDGDARLLRRRGMDERHRPTGRFLFLPATTITGSYNVSHTMYDDDSAPESWSQSVLAGLDHTIGPRLSGSLQAGVHFIRPKSSLGSSSTERAQTSKRA